MYNTKKDLAIHLRIAIGHLGEQRAKSLALHFAKRGTDYPYKSLYWPDHEGDLNEAVRLHCLRSNANIEETKRDIEWYFNLWTKDNYAAIVYTLSDDEPLPVKEEEYRELYEEIDRMIKEHGKDHTRNVVFNMVRHPRLTKFYKDPTVPEYFQEHAKLYRLARRCTEKMYHTEDIFLINHFLRK